MNDGIMFLAGMAAGGILATWLHEWVDSVESKRNRSQVERYAQITADSTYDIEREVQHALRQQDTAEYAADLTHKVNVLNDRVDDVWRKYYELRAQLYTIAEIVDPLGVRIPRIQYKDTTE